MFLLCLQHCLHQIHLDWERRYLYELSVEKLVLSSFRGYLGEFWQDLLIGGELGGVCRCSSCVFSIVSTKFTLIGNDDIYTNLVWKSWCFQVFADISATSNRGKKQHTYVENFKTVFFPHAQCCVRVSASNVYVLTRKNGGARAFGNIVRFGAGPARRFSGLRFL